MGRVFLTLWGAGAHPDAHSVIGRARRGGLGPHGPSEGHRGGRRVRAVGGQHEAEQQQERKNEQHANDPGGKARPGGLTSVSLAIPGGEIKASLRPIS